MQKIDSDIHFNKLGKIVVLLGGYSAEREISLNSGNATLEALRRQGIDVVAIDTQKNAIQQLEAELTKGEFGAFIALHGFGGEDGKIQGLLEYLEIPYTGSGVLASSLCMDKLRTKQLWQGVGLPTANYVVLTPTTDWQAAIEGLQGEAMVKPNLEGSSIGMSRVDSAEALKAAYEKAVNYDTCVLAEQFITGAEYTVAILEGEALPAIRLQAHGDFYDYNAKYIATDTEYLCPCGLSEDKERELKRLALKAFNAVGAQGWGRVDVMADSQENFYLLEVNTVPGLTDHSLVPMAAKAAGIGFDDLVLQIALQTVSHMALPSDSNE